MIKIIVASKNPVKINATLKAFKKMFPRNKLLMEGVSVSSGVSDQPKSDEESLTGSHNRASNAKKQYPDADYWIGLEAAVGLINDKMSSFSWVVVISKDGKIGRGRTATYILPDKVADLINQGKELGEANDIIFDKHNSKQNNGSVGILTHDVIDRTEIYWPAIALALIPYKNLDLY